MLNHPVLPAILLAISAWRLVAGTATWFTAVSALAAALWFASAWKNWRAKREAARMPSQEESPPLPPASESSPRRLSPDQMAAYRKFIAGNRQVPEPPPLPSEAEIRATAKPAIALIRGPLPVPLDAPGRSYLGGLPRLPPGLEWPEMEKHERFAPTFMAQIDLSELPQHANPLPRAGTLYFFADTNDDSPEPGDCRVLFHAGDASAYPLRDLPATARPYGCGGEPWPWLPESSTWSKTGFRFPLEFVAFDSVRDYGAQEGGGMPPRRNRDAFKKIMATEFARRFGRQATRPTEAWRTFERTGDEWPFAWVAVEFAARAIAGATEEALARRESSPVRDRLLGIGAAAASWFERAGRETSHALLPADARQAFLTDWRAWDTAFDEIGRELRIHVRSHSESFNVVTAACYVCASNGAADVIPESFLQALGHLADPAVGFPEHQMFGHGQKVQWAPVERAGQTLLLHLFGERALGWHADSGCALQFWIESAELARADFGSVEMTLECD